MSASIPFENGQAIATSVGIENGSLKVVQNRYDALFFGSVGTLVHLSERQYKAFQQTLKEKKLPEWNKDQYVNSLTLTGGKNRLAAWSKDNDLGLTTEDCVALHARKMEIFEEDMRAGLDVRPGVIELLNAARAAGVKTAWVTTTPEGPMKAQLEGMKGLNKEMFDFFMSEADAPKYGRGKPTADPYLYAMKTLKVKNPICFEDSSISMKSPLAANLDVIATPNNWCTTHDYTGALARVDEPSQLIKRSGLSNEENAQLTALLAKTGITC